jgi:hypothetical protein
MRRNKIFAEIKKAVFLKDGLSIFCQFLIFNQNKLVDNIFGTSQFIYNKEKVTNIQADRAVQFAVEGYFMA